MTSYERVENPDAPRDVWLKRDDGTQFRVDGVVTDAADGIDPDEDFDFERGKEWAAETEDATED